MSRSPRPGEASRSVTQQSRQFVNRQLRAAVKATEQPVVGLAPRRRLPIAARVALGLVGVILIGTFLLMLPRMSARPLTITEAFFVSTSAVTVSGLSVLPTPLGSSFTLGGQLVLLLLMQVGGVGYMFAAALVLRLVGRQVPLLDRLALSDSLGLDKSAAILRLLRHVLIGILLVEGIGTLFLYLHWQAAGIGPADRRLFYALFHAVSNFCNVGFDLFTPAEGGLPLDSGSIAIFGLLIFMGGLGIPVLSDFVSRRQRRRFSMHTRLTLSVTFALIVVGWVGLLLTESTGSLAHLSAGEQWGLTLFQSISARTGGFAILSHMYQISTAGQLLLMGLMFIGSAPASMGGGITTGTLAVLLLTLWSQVRGEPQTRLFGRAVSPGTVKRAGAVLTVSVLVILSSTWLLLATHDFSMAEALFEVISAFSTTGLSLGITPDLNSFGRWLIILLMIWGRLGALTIVIALTQRATPSRVLYPEESLLIG